MVLIVGGALIGAFLVYRSHKKGNYYGDVVFDTVMTAFFGALFGFVVAMVIGAVTVTLISPPEYEYSHEDKLVALSDSGTTSGKFFLGSGRIDKSFVYVYYYERSDGAIRLSHVDTDKADVYEDRRKGATLKVFIQEHRFMHLFYVDPNKNNYRYEFHVPEGTVKRDLNLDLDK